MALCACVCGKQHIAFILFSSSGFWSRSYFKVFFHVVHNPYNFAWSESVCIYISKSGENSYYKETNIFYWPLAPDCFIMFEI